jgi:hypothetical protein
MPCGALHVTAAVSVFLSILSCSPLSVVASHLKSLGTVIANYFGDVGE